MAPRPAWKGQLRISLVSVPSQAFVGSAGEEGPIRLNQLHKICHSRIRYVKSCPIHGPVPNDEIVSGYEYAKGEYVEIDPQELTEMRPKGDRSIDVDVFVPGDSVDAAFFTGRMYYLVPDGAGAQKPYQLICAAMENERLDAIARMQITTREHVVRIRPHEGILVVDVLAYAAQIQDPAEFKPELIATHPSPQEQKLTRQLISSMAEKKVDLSRYQDKYSSQVRELIDAKVEGKELVTAAPAEEPRIVNLMDALRASMSRAPRKSKQPTTRRRVAPSVARRTTAKNQERRRKSG